MGVEGIRVDQLSKRYRYEWIFRGVSLQIAAGEKVVITGSNGSGKSTLLKVLSGILPQTDGTLHYRFGGKDVDIEEVYRFLSFVAPYMELPEELSVRELIHFHFQFKSLLPGLTERDVLAITYLESHGDKLVSELSSGMKQRLKLALALFSDVPLVLLDEPTSNLDLQGVDWYLELIARYANDRTVIVCSNDAREYAFCTKNIAISVYK
ncbi:ABC transporter [Nitritalea halalkaliphila LW7]|uniref:ABC transporter n=1 Tax=Nitritalea halalkaliphila LW7 TaxID=1189621 RepID=I5C1G7_9BACT|nr:ABC transporter ATP-binding protein [Nitritalea halalkaliphila]EIM75669.1 ABC transporter [Nitritalea halalkaliphila LW7]